MNKDLSKQVAGSLKDAANEIKSLRKRNELMSARLEMFDNMMLIFTSSPAYKGQGMAPDIVYDLEKQAVYLEELQKEGTTSKQ